MTEKNYDWRKGREWIEISDRDNWAKRKLREENPDKEIDEDKISEFLNNHIVTWASSLEGTLEEVKKWRQFYEEIESQEKQLGQSLAYISHPKLGRLYALETLIRTGILERESLWAINSSLIDVRKDNDMLEHWQKQNVILRDIASRVLEGNVLTREELFGNRLTYMVDGMRGEKKEESSNYANLTWHWMVQFSNIDKLPYLPFISEDEARGAIGAYLNDRLAFYQKNKSNLGGQND